MPETKKYAVLCSTEEQSREFRGNIGGYIHGNLYYLTDCGFFGHIDYVSKNGYTIITYEEAVGLGLLGEKEICKSCLGKKQVSVYKGDSVGSPDFPGDKPFLYGKGGIKMIDCSRCNGTGVEPSKEVEIENDIIDQMDSFEKEEVKEESKIEEPDLYQQGFERGRQIGYKEGWKAAMKEIDDIYIEQQKREHLNK